MLGKLPAEVLALTLTLTLNIALTLTPTLLLPLPLPLPLTLQVLAEHAPPIVAHMADQDADVREATLRALGKPCPYTYP